jgi:uncharacterized protein (TIGR03067 family)
MIEGTWVPIEAEFNGEKLPAESLKQMKLLLKGNTYAARIGGVIDRGTISFEPAKKALGLNITGTDGPNKGKTIKAIYELNNETMKVCCNLGGQSRPEEFKTGTDLFLVTYKRE